MDGVKITGLWKERTADAQVILSGRLNAMASLVVVPNEAKASDRDPDYLVLVRQNPKTRPDAESSR